MWSLALAGPHEVFARCRKILAADELKRAEAYKRPVDRERFVFVRAVLRALVSHYTGSPTQMVRFAYGQHRKPFIALPNTEWQFNVSHSGGLAIYAFTQGLEVGIDIEEIRDCFDVVDVAEKFFAPEEAEEIRSLPETHRPEAFFRCWTRKEAFTKALGDGLFIPLDSFRITLLPSVPARITRAGNSSVATEDWILDDLPVALGYAAAIAYRGLECDLEIVHLGSVNDALLRLAG